MTTTGRRFAAQETTIYRDLQNTMTKVKATTLRISPRDLMNAKDVQAEIRFDRGGRRYVVRCKKWANWLDNLRAAERCIYYLHRAIEEYGVTTSESGLDAAFAQFFVAFEAPPDDTVLMLTDGKVKWHEVLGVDPTKVNRQGVINAFRALARVHHPDFGGSPDDFKRIKAAYDEGVAATSKSG